MNFGFDLVALNAFIGVGEIGGFRAAADELGMTPSGVSKAIARLERRLGTRLIARTTRSVKLTKEGLEFHSRCKEILQDLAQVERDIASNSSATREQLSVSAPTAFGRSRVVPLIAEFSQRHPTLCISLRLEDRRVNLDDEDVAVAVRIGNLTDQQLLATRASTTSFVCCASPGYLTAMGAPSKPSDLLRHRCIGFLEVQDSSRPHWLFANDGSLQVISPNFKFSLNDSAGQLAAAEAGAGIIMVHRYLADASINEGRLVSVLDDFAPPALPIWILRSRQKRNSPAARTLIDFLKLRLHESCDSTS
ncbi:MULTISPECIES: LysR family transcriptional regulator [unclassified Paraburkholderia]|uniref:LysR family transcriptional regulator n=1 Tax=unclassified Paraburkholderia TaxID=2615204 RepID=UPI001607D53D|nr:MULTISPECIES: LysR family transcriptional regulator [unclassified Paraburkholderia]MBB5447779.1 LysR family transcriptional regulator for bpeEF and oprC [Paraburkholderia sp. WSM4177]MBB5488284.1 LysR family transcriptional regulator for bpeEF and oprC [Paraburkholderia sp. WSM4180]